MESETSFASLFAIIPSFALACSPVILLIHGAFFHLTSALCPFSRRSVAPREQGIILCLNLVNPRIWHAFAEFPRV